MAFYTIKEARDAFTRSQSKRTVKKAAAEMLNEEVAAVRADDKFDFFLSHCLADAELVRGVKAIFEEKGYKVYVDWIVDKQLDRAKVTPDTANVLRQRMRQSTSMIFATSESSPNSKWMPWELGYFDGLRQGRIAVMPLVASVSSGFTGQEYLGLYPLIEELKTTSGVKNPYVTKGKGSGTYMELGEFRNGQTTFRSY